MTQEVKIHSDPLSGLTSWVFYRPKWISIGQKKTFSKVLTLYTVRKLTKNWANINKKGSKKWTDNELELFEDLENQIVIWIKLQNKSRFYEETFSLRNISARKEYNLMFKNLKPIYPLLWHELLPATNKGCHKVTNDTLSHK